MTVRPRSDSGFALIELLAAIVMINVGILAILLSLNSGMVTLRRSAEVSTGSALADKQLELYRALRYSSVYLDATLVAPAVTDTTYEGDSAYSASQVSGVCSPVVAACTPTQTVTGPDGRSYRLDTFMVWTTPAGGAPVKQVTVVVRRSGATRTLARVTSVVGTDF